MRIALAKQPRSLLGVLPLPRSRPLRECASPDVESPDLLGNPLEGRPGADCSPVALGGKFGTSFVGFRCRLRIREHR